MSKSPFGAISPQPRGLQLGKQVLTRLSLRQEVNYRLLIKPSDVNQMATQEKNAKFPGPGCYYIIN